MNHTNNLAGNFNGQNDLSSNHIVPTIIEEDGRGRVSYDPYSRLLKERIIFFGTQVDFPTANLAAAQLLILDKDNKNLKDEKQLKPIDMYITSPGGVIYAGLGLEDTMDFVKAPVRTTCVGLAASMGSYLLAAGEPGHRSATPKARIMIHQPLGGAQGQASDIVIQAEEIQYLKKTLYDDFTSWAGLDAEYKGEIDTGLELSEDAQLFEKACDRNNWIDVTTARAIGLIDNIVKKNDNELSPINLSDKAIVDKLREQEKKLKKMLKNPRTDGEKALKAIVDRRIEVGAYDPETHNKYSSDYDYGSDQSPPPPAANAP